MTLPTAARSSASALRQPCLTDALRASFSLESICLISQLPNIKWGQQDRVWDTKSQGTQPLSWEEERGLTPPGPRAPPHFHSLLPTPPKECAAHATAVRPPGCLIIILNNSFPLFLLCQSWNCIFEPISARPDHVRRRRVEMTCGGFWGHPHALGTFLSAGHTE